MIIQFPAVVEVQRVQAKHALNVLLWRQTFGLIVEQISAAEIQLLARHQVAELPQIHEAPNHRVCGWLLLAVIGFDRHQRLLHLQSTFHTCTRF